jgi:hypothetical protein
VAELYGGSLTQFDDSMARAIEDALNEVRAEADFPPLLSPLDKDRAGLPAAVQRDVDERRMLFIAIARGVIRHLQEREQAFKIEINIGPGTITTYPDIQIKP